MIEVHLQRGTAGQQQLIHVQVAQNEVDKRRTDRRSSSRAGRKSRLKKRQGKHTKLPSALEKQPRA
jgi:hypothetical protein